MKTQFANLFNMENNGVVYTLLVYAAINAYWLAGKEIISGTLYLLLFLSVITVIVFFTFTKQENKYTFPIFMAKENNTAILRYYLGIAFALLVLFIGSIFSPRFSLFSTQAFQPLTSFRSTQAEATFSALEAQNSPFWTMNTIVNFASIFEELLIGVFMVYIIYVAIISLFKNISKEKAIWLALLLDVLVFAILHSFNSTYTTLSMYLIAGIFRFITNFLIYIAGLGVEFTIGMHAANNAIFLGINTVMSGLLSWQAFFFIAINVAFIYALFKYTKDWGRLFRSISYKLDR